MVELAAGDDEGMAELFIELKQLLGLTGRNIRQGLRALLNDTNSALSRTLGDRLSSIVDKVNKHEDSQK